MCKDIDKKNKGYESKCSPEHNYSDSDSHSHSHGHSHNHSAENIKSAFILNLLFTIIEFFGGLYTNSTAIMSDAIHDLGDTFSLGLSWLLENKSNKGSDNTMPYGYGRYSIIGGALNTLILFMGTSLILLNTIPRLFNPQPVNSKGMLLLAIIGVVINGIAVLKIKDGVKISEKVVTLHLLEDVLGWVTVLIVSLILQFVDVPILDPLLSIGISIFIMKNVIINSKSICGILLQKTPSMIDINNISDEIIKLDFNIHNVNNLKCWSIDGNIHVADLNITLVQTVDNNDSNVIAGIKTNIRKHLKDYNIEFITIEIS